MDRFTLNTYIERLIDSHGHDEEARNGIAEFGRGLKQMGKMQLEGSLTRPGSGFSGQTPEHGTLKVDDGKEERKEFAVGVEKERVGYYKIWRQKDRKNDWVVMAHYWKSDVETRSQVELPQQWALALLPDGQPAWFGERGLRHVRTLRFTRVITIQIDREIYLEEWGENEGSEHLGPFAVTAVFRITRDD